MLEPALLLNATHEPLRVITWRRAILLLWQGKVDVLAQYDREVRGVRMSLRLPSVLRLQTYIKLENGRQQIRFSRTNVFLRDDYRCQYCGGRFRATQLTIDHVMPLARNGTKTWENIVSACWTCNNKKSGRTPEEAGMRLFRHPKRPPWRVTFTMGPQQAPEPWRDYLVRTADRQ